MEIESDRRDKKSQGGADHAPMTDGQGGKGGGEKDPFAELSRPTNDETMRKELHDRVDTTKDGSDISGRSSDRATEQQRNHDLFGK